MLLAHATNKKDRTCSACLHCFVRQCMNSIHFIHKSGLEIKDKTPGARPGGLEGPGCIPDESGFSFGRSCDMVSRARTDRNTRFSREESDISRRSRSSITPGRISAVVFHPGVQPPVSVLHNPEPGDPKRSAPAGSREVLSYLKAGRARSSNGSGTSAVSAPAARSHSLHEGGEGLGFLVKLVQNGTLPGVVSRAIGEDAVDFVARTSRRLSPGIRRSQDAPSIPGPLPRASGSSVIPASIASSGRPW